MSLEASICIVGVIASIVLGLGLKSTILLFMKKKSNYEDIFPAMKIAPIFKITMVSTLKANHTYLFAIIPGLLFVVGTPFLNLTLTPENWFHVYASLLGNLLIMFMVFVFDILLNIVNLETH